jgi:hypothetical protein
MQLINYNNKDIEKIEKIFVRDYYSYFSDSCNSSE